jgi:hypothetical protein
VLEEDDKQIKRLKLFAVVAGCLLRSVVQVAAERVISRGRRKVFRHFSVLTVSSGGQKSNPSVAIVGGADRRAEYLITVTDLKRQLTFMSFAKAKSFMLFLLLVTC